MRLILNILEIRVRAVSERDHVGHGLDIFQTCPCTRVLGPELVPKYLQLPSHAYILNTIELESCDLQIRKNIYCFDKILQPVTMILH